MAKLKNIIRIIVAIIAFTNYSVPSYAKIGDVFVINQEADFVMVGNVNFEIPGGYNFSTETTRKIIPIGNDAEVANSSSRNFCLPVFECTSDSIEKAILTWSGRLFADDTIALKNKWQTVKYKMNGGSYTEITASDDDCFYNNDGSFVDAKGIYTCHYDFTKELRNMVENVVPSDKSTNISLTIADIQSSTTTYKEGEVATKFGGWTLTVIYKKEGKRKSNIAYYPLKRFAHGGYGGSLGDPMEQAIPLPAEYNGAGNITVGVVTAGTTRSDKAKLYIDHDPGLTDGTGLNAESSMDNVIYERSGCSEDLLTDDTIKYSKGYDQLIKELKNTIDQDGKGKYLDKGGKDLYLKIEGNVEQHLLSDVIVMSGIPSNEIEAVQTGNKKGDACVEYSIDINTGKYIEYLNNFNLDIKLPDYTTEVSNFSISGALVNSVKDQKKNVFGINTHGQKPSENESNSVNRNDTINGWFRSEYILGSNSKILNRIQAKAADFETKSETEQYINIKYNGLIPDTLNDTTIITIKFTACVDSVAYAAHSALTGENSEVVSQSNVSVSGAASGDTSFAYSNPKSEFEQREKENCADLFMFGGDGDLDGGGGGGGGGGGAGGGGGGGINGEPTKVSMNFKFECMDIPDTIRIDACINDCIPFDTIKSVMLREHNFDLDAIAREDSINWLKVKKDSIIDLCQLSIKKKGDLRKAQNTLYSDSCNWLFMKQYWERQPKNLIGYNQAELFDNMHHFCKVDSAYVVDYVFKKIDKIISNPIEVSHVDYLLDMHPNWATNKCIPVTKSDTISILYATPHIDKNKRHLCNDSIRIVINMEEMDEPKLTHNGKEVLNGETVQFCLGATIDTFLIKKKKPTYSVKLTNHETSFTQEANDTIIKYVPSMETDVAGLDTFKFIQRNNTGCESDTFKLIIEILNVQASNIPTIQQDTFACLGRIGDSISIKITDLADVESMRQNGFDVRWVLRRDALLGDSVLRENVTEINVPTDSVGLFTYGAQYYYLGCSSDINEVTVNVHELAGKVTQDSIKFCQYIKPTADEILPYIKAAATTDTLYWFPTNTNLINNPTFEEKDSMLLNRLLEQTNFNECGKKQLIVRAKNIHGCFGDTSLITINVLCFDSTSTKFTKKGDSVLYCVGDIVTTIDQFIDKDRYPTEDKYVWEWFKEETYAPHNTITGPSPYAPDEVNIQSNQPSNTTYYVTRKDNNNCISNVSAFKVVVDNAISEMPLIDDPRALEYRNDTFVTLGFCKGVQAYPSDKLPLIATLSNYHLEWTEKSSQDVRCDTFVKKETDTHKNKYEQITVNTNTVGRSYYCIRQSTVLGCKGPWKNVEIIINDSVRALPLVKDIVLCQGEDSVQVKDYVQYSGTEPLVLNFFDKNKNYIEVTDSAYVLAKDAGKFTKAKNNNLYYVSLSNTKTFCEGKKLPVDVIINPKPHLPQMNEDTTVYLCAIGDTVNLTQRIEAVIDNRDYDTKIEWAPNDTIITNGDINKTYEVYQRDTITQCVGDPIEISVMVSNTIKYTEFGTKSFCHGETISLRDTVRRNLKHNDKIIGKDGIKYNIYLLNGGSRGIEITSPIKSGKSRHESDTTRYLINIVDEISGCEKKDTATIIFHALPNAKVKDQLDACQGVAITLPTPTESAYNYQWTRNAGDEITGIPTLLTLTNSETIFLYEENKATGCIDTFKVDVTVYPTPASAITKDTAFCQNNTTKEIKVQVQTTDDGFNNEVSKFNLQWFNEQKDSVVNPILTDTITMNEVSRELKYTVRQRNTITQCFKDTTITVTLKKTPVLAMPDLQPVCEPDTISFVKLINEYISNHISSTNLANLNGIHYKYGKIINGSAISITEQEANEIHYTNDLDSVLYTYTITDADKVCSASDSVYITINKKPLVPVIESGVDTIYFCQDDAPIQLGAENKNEEKYPTSIYWGDYQSTQKGDSLGITARASNYMAFTKNEKTGCVSDIDTIHAVISLPIVFNKIKPQHLCFRDSLDLYGMVKKQVLSNTQNSKSDLQFSIYKMSGSVPLPTPIVKSVLSNKAINETDTTRYLIEIKDHVSGCAFTDTATVIFHGLPVIESIPDIAICQYQDTALPTPKNNYQYEWFRASDDKLINDPSHFNTDIKEYLYLKATETFSTNNLTCYDSIMVYMDVRTIPAAAVVKSDTFCQFSGEHLIKAEIKESLDNPRANLSIQWINENGEKIPNPINTDAIEVANKSVSIKYTIRQYNTINGCYQDTVVPFVVNKAIRLEMEDLKAVCQPEVIDFRGKVLDYLTSANTNISNVSNCEITYGKIINLNESPLTDEEVSNISYTEGIDSMLYVYHVKDNVCESADSVYVTINFKPTTPIIEEGIDTIYFCASNQEMKLGASQVNDKAKVKIFWGDYKSSTSGDTLPILGNAPIAKYTAFSKNIQSGCTSGFDTIVAVVKDTIGVEPIGENGTLIRCEGETIDLYEIAMASFKFNKAPASTIRFSATENGYAISEGELQKIRRTNQDTSYYLFSVEDDMTGCNATNRLTLIYHKNPTFSIEGDDILCEGDNIRLKAKGETRPVSYAWQFKGSASIVNQTDSFLFRNITHDTTIVLIEKLNGTTCADTVTKAIKVNMAPAQLQDTAIAICQDTTAKIGVSINLNRSNDEIQAYLIKWYNDDDSFLSDKESIEVDQRGSTTFKYQVETINKNTKCVSQRSNVVVTINPQITIGLENPDTICQPFTYDLKKNLFASISGGTRPSYVSTTLNGEIIDNEGAITESGKYIVNYTDDNQCEASKTISIQFYEQPSTPQLIGDTIVCQGTSTVKLTAKRMGANNVNQTFEWQSASDITVADTLYLSTDSYGKTPYTLRAVDKLSNCYSEPTTFNFDIREKIGFSPVGLLEGCYGTTIDLADKIQSAHSGSEEKKILTYFYITEANSLNKIDTPESINESGRYLIKASEEESGCVREDTVKVLFHDSIAVSIKGDTVICQGDEVNDLKAYNAEEYTWVRGNGSSSTGSSFPFASSVKESERFRLVGKKKMGSLFCEDSIVVNITVNENPAILTDTTIFLCQDTSGAPQSIARQAVVKENEKLALVWMNTAGDTLFNGTNKAITPITEEGTTIYYVSQINKETQCTNKAAQVTVNVLPQIKIHLEDTTTCVPFSINLVNIASSAAQANEHNDDITIASYELMSNGTAVNVNSQADSLTQEGTYRIRYQYESDGTTCQSEGAIHLYFNKQPIQPSIADQNFCQNTGDHELAGKVNTTNVRLLWEDLSVYPSQVDTNTATISTSIAGQKKFLIRQIQDLSGCISQPDTAIVNIYPAITSIDKDTAICHGEFIDLNQFAQGSYLGGTPKHSVSFKNADGQSFNAERVMKSNTYFAYFADSANICHNTATFSIYVDDPIHLAIEGTGIACTDQTIVLEVSGAEQYEWSNGTKGNSISVSSQEAETKNFSVEGRRPFHDIYCTTDTSVSVEFHNAVKPRNLSFDTCAGNVVTIDDVIRKNNIVETIDTIWNKTDEIRYSNLNQNLGKSGQYEIAVHNEEGCAAHHTLNVKMHRVENFRVDKQESTYCYGSLANFTAYGENVRSFEWTNLNEGIVKEGNRYNEPITEKTDFQLVATESELGCQDTLLFSVEAYPFNEISVSGNQNSCLDSIITLSVESVLTDIIWNFGDSLSSERTIHFVADKDRRIKLTGIDPNGCPAEKNVVINVANIEDPVIEYDKIENSEYALSDDVNEIELREKHTPEGSDLYSYTWEFGDGHAWSGIGGKVMLHHYNDTIIRSRRDIQVKLTVEHAYGCQKSTSTILTIDPFLFVPNTMIADGEYIFMENYDLQIFDRVGTLIYQGRGWDGTYKGMPATEDTYFYAITYYEKGEKIIKTGFITLVR